MPNMIRTGVKVLVNTVVLITLGGIFALFYMMVFLSELGRDKPKLEIR